MTARIGSLSPEYALLGFLAEHPNHGYELHQRLAGELGHVWHVSQSQVYTILKRLESHADITGSPQEQQKHPIRTLYALTPSGRARFDTWLNTPTRCSVRAIRVEFITRLYFASRRSSATTDAIIDAQVEEVHQGLLHLQAMKNGLPSQQAFNHLSLELRLNQLASILDWLERCRSVVHHQTAILVGDQP